MGSIWDGDDTIAGIVWILTSIGALNWGLKELFSADLLVELGLSGSTLGYAYIVVGVAGAIVLIDMLDIVGSEGADASPLED